MLIAAPPGTGKTLIAITAAQQAGARRILVVCPAIAQGVWPAEVPKVWPEATAVLLRDLVAGAPLPAGPVFVITSYDYLVANAAARAWIAAANSDFGIADESHAMKSPTAKRTQLLLGPRCAGDGLLANCARVILLSGTPTPNGFPSELWPALRCFAPDLIGRLDYEPFCRIYCRFKLRQVQTRYGIKTIEQIAGASSRAPELARAIAPFWHRPPSDVIDRDLPTLRTVIRHLPAELLDAKEIAKAEAGPEADELRAAIAAGDLRDTQGNMSRFRRLFADVKAPATAAWVEGALEEGEPKVIVWTWHTAPLHELHARLTAYGPVLVDGSTPQRDRDAAVERFQSDPSCKIFLGQIQAAGQAITLTAARRAVFLEQAWTPSANYQAAKRMHRIGQVWPCLAEVLCIRGSIDEAVQGLLVKKAQDIRALEAA